MIRSHVSFSLSFSPGIRQSKCEWGQRRLSSVAMFHSALFSKTQTLPFSKHVSQKPNRGFSLGVSRPLLDLLLARFPAQGNECHATNIIEVLGAGKSHRVKATDHIDIISQSYPVNEEHGMSVWVTSTPPLRIEWMHPRKDAVSIECPTPLTGRRWICH